MNLPDRLLDEAATLNQSLVKFPFQTEDTRLTLSTNLWQVYQGARRGEEGALVQTPSHCCIDKTTRIWDD